MTARNTDIIIERIKTHLEDAISKDLEISFFKYDIEMINVNGYGPSGPDRTLIISGKRD